MTDYRYRKVPVIDDVLTGDYSYESPKDLVLRDMVRYPNNGMIHKQVYEKFLNNIHRIPIKALDKFLDKHNCI